MSLSILGCIAVVGAAGLSLLLGVAIGLWVERHEDRNTSKARRRAWRVRR